MPISPETQPVVEETPVDFSVPENLTNEIKAIETNPKTTVQVNSQGQPVIGNVSAQSAKIQLPGDDKTLLKQAQGSITNAFTWLARFLLRMKAKKKSEGVKEEYADNVSD